MTSGPYSAAAEVRAIRGNNNIAQAQVFVVQDSAATFESSAAGEGQSTDFDVNPRILVGVFDVEVVDVEDPRSKPCVDGKHVGTRAGDRQGVGDRHRTHQQFDC